MVKWVRLPLGSLRRWGLALWARITARGQAEESKIRKLIKIVEESNISELEVSRWGRKIRISKYPSNQDASPDSSAPVTLEASKADKEIAISEEDKIGRERLHEIKSPMVGTFYRAPAPDAEPYVRVGDAVVVGQIVCIVEAMKLMNEIESDVKGKIVDILIGDAEPVEYGQTLFLVNPD